MAKWNPMSRKRFGVASGRHSKKRITRAKRKHYQCNVVSDNKLKICRRIIRKSYRRLPRLFSISDNELYRCQYTGQSLKFLIRKVSAVNVKGYRMINLDQLQQHMSELMKHCVKCIPARDLVLEDKTPMQLVSEVRTRGLASVLLVKCVGCKSSFEFETSPKLKEDNITRYDINVRAVWGSIATGNGAAHLNELMATMDSPGISKSAFSAVEHQIGRWWEKLSESEILAAGYFKKPIVTYIIA